MAHPKGMLIERLQQLGRGTPEFRSERSGPDHQPTFRSDVLIEGKIRGTGSGSSKREAERNAAEEALRSLGKSAAPTSSAGSARAESRSGEQQVAAEHGDEFDDAPFEGPWPLFETVLATAMQIAERRIADNLRGAEARVAVRDFSLELYKELLQDLGEVVDEDDPD